MSNAIENPVKHGIYEVCVIVTEKNGKPAVELRSLTTNTELIKLIISSAYHTRPLVIMPKFTNLIQSLNSCVDKGILFRENEHYFFTV